MSARYGSSRGEQVENRIAGVMVGVVTNNKDPEKLARVKLKLPIMENEHETGWVRVATMMGGKDRGSLFVPEVGDEVLVAFHMGDIRRPFVVGVLWSKEQPSPAGNEDNHIRKIKSKAGHEFIFSDDPQDEKITLKTKKGHKLELSDKDDKLLLVDSNSGNSLMIKSGTSGEITVKSGTSTIVLNNKGDISITSDKSIKLKAMQVDVEASAMMSLKAGTNLDLKADGLVTIKGSVVKIN